MYRKGQGLLPSFSTATTHDHGVLAADSGLSVPRLERGSVRYSHAAANPASTSSDATTDATVNTTDDYPTIAVSSAPCAIDVI